MPMSEKIFPTKKSLFLILIFPVLLSIGCSVEAAKSRGNEKTADANAKNAIAIEKNSPADTVRVFYKNLRENRFRDALFLTNLRPAIEGLTDAELKDLQVDFANLAKQIPGEVEINGEIIAGDEATVTAHLPDNETDETDLQQIKLRRDKASGVWTILTLDDETAQVVAREGKDYLFNLRIETHEREAKKMFDRIAKAEIVFAAQNGGQYGDLAALVAKELLPEDALNAESTGYNYKITLPADKKSYSAAAEPAVYGKTGRRSYGFSVDAKGKISALRSVDEKAKLAAKN
jgi:hypothetical protein